MKNKSSIWIYIQSVRRTVCVLLALTLFGVGFSQDYARLSERTIMGTARYVGMSGAMSAIGGDPSAVRDNPAGLGLYRRTELMLTADVSTPNGAYFTVPQASWVFSVPTVRLQEIGVLYHNFMFSYHRLHTYDCLYLVERGGDVSLGRTLENLHLDNWGNFKFPTDEYNAYNKTRVQEYGAIHEVGFNWGMNVSNTWYVGAGIRVPIYRLYSYGDYEEKFDTQSPGRQNQFITNSSTLYLNGVGCSASLGLIYRPTVWLRLGLGIQTPSLGSLRTRTYGTLKALTDSVRTSEAPDQYGNDKQFHQPFNTTVSAAFQIGAYGMIAAQYDYAHAWNVDDRHTMKVGLEFIPVLGLYVNLGYAYESTFKPYRPAAIDPTFMRQDTYSMYPRVSQYASAAFGYRGQYMIVQAAYQFHWKQTAFYPLDKVQPFDLYQMTHRIVLTLGWHRD